MSNPTSFRRESAPRRINVTLSEEAFQFLLDEVRRDIRHGLFSTRSSVVEEAIRLRRAAVARAREAEGHE